MPRETLEKGVGLAVIAGMTFGFVQDAKASSSQKIDEAARDAMDPNTSSHVLTSEELGISSDWEGMVVKDGLPKEKRQEEREFFPVREVRTDPQISEKLSDPNLSEEEKDEVLGDLLSQTQELALLNLWEVREQIQREGFTSVEDVLDFVDNAYLVYQIVDGNRMSAFVVMKDYLLVPGLPGERGIAIPRDEVPEIGIALLQQEGEISRLVAAFRDENGRTFVLGESGEWIEVTDQEEINVTFAGVGAAYLLQVSVDQTDEKQVVISAGGQSESTVKMASFRPEGAGEVEALPVGAMSNYPEQILNLIDLGILTWDNSRDGFVYRDENGVIWVWRQGNTQPSLTDEQVNRYWMIETDAMEIAGKRISIEMNPNVMNARRSVPGALQFSEATFDMTPKQRQALEEFIIEHSEELPQNIRFILVDHYGDKNETGRERAVRYLGYKGAHPLDGLALGTRQIGNSLEMYTYASTSNGDVDQSEKTWSAVFLMGLFYYTSDTTLGIARFYASTYYEQFKSEILFPVIKAESESKGIIKFQ